MTKTTKQIEESAEAYSITNYSGTKESDYVMAVGINSFIAGYTECAKDMDGETIGFAEWIVTNGYTLNINGFGRQGYSNDGVNYYTTTADLLTLYRESLKK